MKVDLGRVLRRYFPGSFEMIVVGITFIFLSTPGIGMIFVTSDSIFPHMFTSLRNLGIAWLFDGLSRRRPHLWRSPPFGVARNDGVPRDSSLGQLMYPCRANA